MKCGSDVSGEMGEHRHGDYVCVLLQADPLAIRHGMLLKLASHGHSDLLAIQGYQVTEESGAGRHARGNRAARHEQTGKQVALKVMLPKVAVDEHAKAEVSAGGREHEGP